MKKNNLNVTAVQQQLLSLLETLSGRRGVTLDDNINFDLRIGGDDADELIDEIHKTFGTSFKGLDLGKFFPDEGIDSVFRFGLKGKQPISVRHLLMVIEAGAWFEPIV
jgi:hypothetical protein